jgi:hypothetical protein
MIYVLTKYGELRFYRYGETDQITKKKDIINTVSSAEALQDMYIVSSSIKHVVYYFRFKGFFDMHIVSSSKLSL